LEELGRLSYLVEGGEHVHAQRERVARMGGNDWPPTLRRGEGSGRLPVRREAGEFFGQPVPVAAQPFDLTEVGIGAAGQLILPGFDHAQLRLQPAQHGRVIDRNTHHTSPCN
ncbi:MAG: hypothetical protein ACPH9E_11240, partial [Hyphomonas sp.]